MNDTQDNSLCLPKHDRLVICSSVGFLIVGAVGKLSGVLDKLPTNLRNIVYLTE